MRSHPSRLSLCFDVLVGDDLVVRPWADRVASSHCALVEVRASAGVLTLDYAEAGLGGLPVEDGFNANGVSLRTKFPTSNAYHDWFLKLLGIFGDSAAARRLLVAAREQKIPVKNPYGYSRAFTYNPTREQIETIQALLRHTWGTVDPVVMDCFAGGGSIPFRSRVSACGPSVGKRASGSVRPDRRSGEALKGLGKVLTSDDQAKAPAWLKAKAWPYNQTHVSTEEVRREFARRISLPILLDITQF